MTVNDHKPEADRKETALRMRFEEDREMIARLLGRLLARSWLRRQSEDRSPRSAENP